MNNGMKIHNKIVEKIDQKNVWTGDGSQDQSRKRIFLYEHYGTRR